MPTRPIRIRGKPISVHKAIVSPDFGSKTVLVVDPWDYVEMWLKRSGNRKAQFYWLQSKAFFTASMGLPKTSSPLTTYYAFLNAVKSLLVVKHVESSEQHGVSGARTPGRTSLSHERVTFQRHGVLAALCRYLGEPAADETYSLKDLLYNLPYIHRAYSLTYRSQAELFIPISKPHFVRREGSPETWFCAEITESRYASGHSLERLPSGFERDLGVTDCCVIRRKRRFQWRRGSQYDAANRQRLRQYHQRTRRDVYYIHGPSRLWYVKRSAADTAIIPRSSLTMTFAAMHRLSELARYDPTGLARHFESRHNWLLAEFVATAPHQFLDEVSSELTGQEFMIPGRKSAS